MKINNGVNGNSYPLVLIIVPNKNGIDHLSYSLNSISKIEYHNFKVVIIDNCSTDDSVDYIKKTYAEFEIFQNETDLGFSGSVNRGLLYSLDINAEFVVVFSNDVQVHPQWLSYTVDVFHNRPEYGVIGFLEINEPYNNSLLKMPSQILFNHQSCPNCAAIFLIRAKLIRKVGLFDEVYYMYGEDNDYFFRCNKAGYQTLQTNIPIWHKGEGFSESIEQQKMVTQYVYRNWLRFAIKNLSYVQIILIFFKMLGYTFLPTIFWENKRVSSGINVSSSINRLVRFKLAYRVKCLLNSIYWNLSNLKHTISIKVEEKNWIREYKKQSL